MKRFLIIMISCLVTFSLAVAQDTKKAKETVNFQIEEMHCDNCIKRIEKNVGFEKGVTDLKCNLEAHTAEVTFRTDKTDIEKIVSAFKKIGMTAVPVETDNSITE